MGWLQSRAARLAPAVVLVGALSTVVYAQSSPSSPPLGFAEVRDATGELVGAASFQRIADGVEIRARFEGLPPGEHGYHVHAVGRCDAPDFMTAEGHFNPTSHEHGMQNSLGSHVGDLPNLVVGEDGTASITAIARYASLAPGDMSLFDKDGSALVIHAGPDDDVSDPAGNSGARIACGVLSAGPAHTEDGHMFVNEPMETQDAFRAAWGNYAAEQWVLERNAALVETRRAG